MFDTKTLNNVKTSNTLTLTAPSVCKYYSINKHIIWSFYYSIFY